MPLTQERLASISRKPTARSSAGRSPQNARTAARLASPGLTVATRKIAARVKGVTTACGAGGKRDGTSSAVNESCSAYGALAGASILGRIIAGLRRKDNQLGPIDLCDRRIRNWPRPCERIPGRQASIRCRKHVLVLYAPLGIR